MRMSRELWVELRVDVSLRTRQEVLEDPKGVVFCRVRTDLDGCLRGEGDVRFRTRDE